MLDGKGRKGSGMTEMGERIEWRGRVVAWSKTGSGPAVVFCHGTPWSSVLWAPFADALSRDFTVYLWDMPGYGLSSKRPEHPVDLGVQGELFADLLAQWGLNAPHVVAHDFGGAVSLRAHLLLGRQFASLFLVDVVALSPWGSPFFNLVKEHADVFSDLPAGVHEGALRAYIESASHSGLRGDELDQLTGPWLTDDGRPAFYRQIAQADERFTDEIRPRLGDVRPPVRIVWGEQDTWIPVDRATSLHDAIPRSTLSLVRASGHLMHHDAPVALADELRAWLDIQTR
ncbi:alpha/beta fold hydrolase [Modestobacter excelsi]|uniref:alpha/beta fold hydrolase n=1 Tax=Modestobacter excelsi TaxID=2213161 RepID=UPI001FE7D646|nr:alpha/beta hydrolase [Modestobacter excelsi]